MRIEVNNAGDELLLQTAPRLPALQFLVAVGQLRLRRARLRDLNVVQYFSRTEEYKDEKNVKL